MVRRQVPAPQVAPSPQTAPSGSGTVGTQAGPLASQRTSPRRQDIDGVHAVPTTHGGAAGPPALPPPPQAESATQAARRAGCGFRIGSLRVRDEWTTVTLTV